LFTSGELVAVAALRISRKRLEEEAVDFRCSKWQFWQVRNSLLLSVLAGRQAENVSSVQAQQRTGHQPVT
jgi:hypothetical protein